MSEQPTPLTRRMKWIIQKMKNHGAIIQESRDAFLEVSHWYLEWEEESQNNVSGRRFMVAEVTERMRCKLIEAKLIWCAENNPVYTKGGKFVTSESVYKLIPEDCMECGTKATASEKVLEPCHVAGNGCHNPAGWRILGRIADNPNLVAIPLCYRCGYPVCEGACSSVVEYDGEERRICATCLDETGREKGV